MTFYSQLLFLVTQLFPQTTVLQNATALLLTSRVSPFVICTGKTKRCVYECVEWHIDIISVIASPSRSGYVLNHGCLDLLDWTTNSDNFAVALFLQCLQQRINASMHALPKVKSYIMRFDFK